MKAETKKRTNSDLYYGLYALGSFDERARKFLETSAERIKGLGKENERLREAMKHALEKHKWNNEESARILEQALEQSEC